MAELATSAGLPLPEIEDAGGCVTVRFRPASLSEMERPRIKDARSHPVKVTLLTERQREILALIDQADRAMALREILAELGPQIRGSGGLQVTSSGKFKKRVDPGKAAILA